MLSKIFLTESSSTSEEVEYQDTRPLWKRALILFCGLESNENESDSVNEEAMKEMQAQMINIEEEKWPSMVVNTAGIAMGCAGVFLFAFYA